MIKKILILNIVFILTFSFLACQKQDIAKIDSIDQKVEIGSGLEPITLENIQKIGTVESIQKVTFKNSQISITPQVNVKDGKLVYPPLTINQELNLADGTKIRIEKNQAIVQTEDKTWAFGDGQSLNFETNTIEQSST